MNDNNKTPKSLQALGLTPMNQKARRLDQAGTMAERDEVQAMQTIAGCTSSFDPGWEVDSGGGTYGLCTPVERDLYDCYHSCYWPAQVPDALTNFPEWTSTCGAPVHDWSKIDLVFP